MLHIEDLRVEVSGKEILSSVNLHIPEGETHILFGPNGSGKSTLVGEILREGSWETSCFSALRRTVWSYISGEADFRRCRWLPGYRSYTSILCSSN